MSKSVDETVFDFFALLLQENDSPNQIVSPQSIVKVDLNQNFVVKQTEAALLDAAILAENGRAAEPKNAEKAITPVVPLQPKAVPRQAEFVAQVSKVAAQVDKQALEKLLAPVLKTARVDPTPPPVVSVVDVNPEMYDVPKAQPIVNETAVEDVLAPVIEPATPVGIM
ncbi:MAG: chemotaxis protein CheW, partial [Shewanella sp.]